MTKQRTKIPKSVQEQVLKEYKHRCARCGGDDPNLHHIDENPSNNDPLNLIPLCPNCHHNWAHNPSSGIDAGRLLLFRLHKQPLILVPQFYPLYKRLQFLNVINDDANVDDLRKSSSEFIRLIKAQEMGAFYGAEIGKLLRYPEFTASFSIGWGGRIPQWYIDGKNNERPQYLKQLREARERVYELVIEMLSYQKWAADSSDERT
jgi:hypothetical protein